VVVACGSALPVGLEGFGQAIITVGDEELTVLVADTPDERRQGLMGVDELPEGIDGMLFVFPTAGSVSFYMLETLIPLDIWWFGADGSLLGGTAMEPCPARPCVSYRSPGPVRWTLETPQGRYELEAGELLSVNSD
jgi:uncharacterized membrane protein (UPF0127 family)